MIADCRPRQIPKNGRSFSRAHRMLSTMPSTPRTPKPPGTSRPSKPDSRASASSGRSNSSDEIQSMSTRTSLAIPPWISASCTDLYESTSAVYLPTTAIRTEPWLGCLIRSTMARHRERSGSGVSSPRRLRTSRSSPCSWKWSGTS